MSIEPAFLHKFFYNFGLLKFIDVCEQEVRNDQVVVVLKREFKFDIGLC